MGQFYGRDNAASGVGAAAGAAAGLVAGLKDKEDARRFDETLNEQKRQADNDIYYKLAVLRHQQQQGKLDRTQQDRLQGLERDLQDKLNKRNNDTTQRGQSLDFQTAKDNRKSNEQIRNDDRTADSLGKESLGSRGMRWKGSGLPRDQAIRGLAKDLNPGLESMSPEDQTKQLELAALAYDGAEGLYQAENRQKAENALATGAGEASDPASAEARLKKMEADANLATAKADKIRLENEQIDPKSTPAYRNKMDGFNRSRMPLAGGSTVPEYDDNKLYETFGSAGPEIIQYASQAADEDVSYIIYSGASVGAAAGMTNNRAAMIRSTVLKQTGDPALADAARIAYLENISSYAGGGVYSASSKALDEAASGGEGFIQDPRLGTPDEGME
jgi:hypothetical protein